MTFPGEPKEIKIPADSHTVSLKALRTLPYEERPFFNGDPSWVVRRMTRARFELWTSKRGWLFDRSGKVLSEAVPPRRDGEGREWYGAFLPDGRWVTYISSESHRPEIYVAPFPGPGGKRDAVVHHEV